MTTEELKKFITETRNAPYFSTLYDLDMWKDDREKLELDQKLLEFFKSRFKFELTSFEGINQLHLKFNNGSSRIVMCLSPEEYKPIKEWFVLNKISFIEE